jgi:hypothetical protein
MALIGIALSNNQTSIGQVVLIAEGGEVVAGPFTSYGKTDARDAIHETDKQVPMKTFGSVSYGNYEIVTGVPTGKDTDYDENTYGSVGALILEASDDVTLRAASRKTSGLMIHGGATIDHGRAPNANGSISLTNDDMAALLRCVSRLLVRGETIVCKVLEDDTQATGSVENRNEGAILSKRFLSTQNLPRRARSKGLVAAGVALSAVAQKPSHDREPHDREGHDRDPHDRG